MKLPYTDVYERMENGFSLKNPNKKVRVNALLPGDTIFHDMDDSFYIPNLEKIDIILHREIIQNKIVIIYSISVSMYDEYKDKELSLDYIKQNFNAYHVVEDSTLCNIYRYSLKKILNDL